MSNLELFIRVTTAVAIIMSLAQLCGRLIQFVNQPRVVGEMISGVLLGPTVFGYFFPEFSSMIFSKDIMPSLFILSNIGLSFYMFLVGAEINFGLFNRSTIKQAGILSFAGTSVPFILGMIVGYWNFDLAGSNADINSFAIYMGTALAITAFPMLARILHEKKLINSKIGVLSLLAASFQDVMSWIMLSFVTAKAMSKGYQSGFVTLIGAFIFLLFVFFVIKPILRRLTSSVEIKGSLDQQSFAIILVLLLGSAITTDFLGLYSVFGGFILGLAMPRTPVFQKELNSKIKDIMVVMFLPIFFAFSGLNTNLLVLGNMSVLVPCLVIILFSILGKYVVCTGVMRFSGFSWRESSAIGGLINARGLMELLIANIGLSYGVINQDLFSILILMAIITTLGASPIYNYSLGCYLERKQGVLSQQDDTTTTTLDEPVANPA